MENERVVGEIVTLSDGRDVEVIGNLIICECPPYIGAGAEAAG